MRSKRSAKGLILIRPEKKVSIVSPPVVENALEKSRDGDGTVGICDS